MNKIVNTLLLVLSFSAGYCGYVFFQGKLFYALIFISGLIFGIFLMNIKIKAKNDKLNIYKRELEKESVSSDEAEAKVKVLESKIKVLEKALESALNK